MLGIFSDAHGNKTAYDQTIALLTSLGATRFVFLGDAVGYIPSAEVVFALRALGSNVSCIRGNHEDMLLRREFDGPREDIYRLAQVNEKLNSHDIKFLKSWPTHRIELINGLRTLFTHGSPLDYTNGYIYPDSELGQFDVDYDIIFVGHSHHAFIRTYGKVRYVNVGSCGLPRDDGRFGSCATLDPATGVIEIYRFDIQSATRQSLSSSPPCHESVLKLFERRQVKVFGKLVP